ncbi:hypothetical protein LguiA_010948 [Lonicera macranthoides]
MAEDLVQQQQQLAFFISGFGTPSSSLPQVHSSVSVVPAMGSVVSAYFMQKCEAAAVHTSITGAQLNQALPQHSNTCLRSAVASPPFSAAPENPIKSADFGINVDPQAKQILPTSQAPSQISNTPLHSSAQVSHLFDAHSSITPPKTSSLGQNVDFPIILDEDLVIAPPFNVVNNTTRGIPESQHQQNSPTVFSQQNSFLHTSQCTLAEKVLPTFSAPVISVAAGAQGSKADFVQYSTPPITSTKTPPITPKAQSAKALDIVAIPSHKTGHNANHPLSNPTASFQPVVTISPQGPGHSSVHVGNSDITVPADNKSFANEVSYAVLVDPIATGEINNAIQEVFGTPSTIPPNHNPGSTSSSHIMTRSNPQIHSSSVESVVPCSVSSKSKKNAAKNKPMHHSTSFYIQHNPTPSSSRSLPHFKQRFHNQFDLIANWENDGEGETGIFLGNLMMIL